MHKPGMQYGCVRVPVSEVLPQAFRVAEAAFLAVPGGPGSHAIEVLIHAMVRAQPLTLRGVAAQHLPLVGQLGADIDVELGIYPLPQGGLPPRGSA